MARRQSIATYKPLLFTTTIRNPERFKDFMFVLYKYNGQILSNELIEEIEKDLFTIGLYKPIKQPKSVKDKWCGVPKNELALIPLTRKEAKQVYDMNDPRQNPTIKGHKEAGFDKGWPSRFQTQYMLMRTLGFVKYSIGEPIVFSEVGIYLASSIKISIIGDFISREPSETPQYEQMAFMQAFAKYQRGNPFIRELNDNIPLILLLQVIKKLNANPNYGNCGISYKELPLVIFWKNNDAEELYQRIVKLRKEHGYNPSNEVIEEICTQEILGGFKRFDLDSIVHEYPDDFVRKMRLTGLVSFRGAGRFIDINHVEDAKVDYIIDTYSSYKKYETEEEFFQYMSTIDENLFSKQAVNLSQNDAAKKLSQWVLVYSWEQIKTELTHLSSKSSSKDDVLKFISAPARLEFLTALAIKSRFPNILVVPNYSCDDEGLPTSTAGGNKGDIECFEQPNGILVEVTMAEGRTQTMMEVWPIERHLKDFQEKASNAQCVFVAPSIFSDTNRQIEFVLQTSQLLIRPYAINNFIEYLENNEYLYCQV